ncbi:hypothetical protein LshimejAT787_0102810 [Lyophyllum shimeji]|uniref:Uncharacterized protein n=1 Tax=Lyophyllum shimeji TaxID=47721 RepID=A0A9P3PCQ1_LYOSH|nr:hypothetical protein LshimejAT787_0102810 [Lyophyllum shimeji]
MPRPGPRLHRLPQRLDYTLIPAPLDLSLPLATEKSPLPAIIVTPSSPSSDHDFSIAFLAPPPKPTIRERIFSYASNKAPTLSLRARTMVIIFVIIFVLVCHVVTHRLAARRPHLEFSIQTGEAHIVDTSINWFNFRSLIGSAPVDAKDVVANVDPFNPPLAAAYIPPTN